MGRDIEIKGKQKKKKNEVERKNWFPKKVLTFLKGLRNSKLWAYASIKFR